MVNHMAFEKIVFKEIINVNGDNKEITYQINDKYVTKEVYDKVSSDESLFVLPPLPKMNGSPKNTCKVVDINKNNSNVEECACEECQELLQVIYDIREMDDNEALEGLRSYVEAIRIKTNLEALVNVYDELGNGMIKTSARLEDQLEEFLSQFDIVEE